MEALRQRVKDLDFQRRELTVRDGKGGKDRLTLLLKSLKARSQEDLLKIRHWHQSDVASVATISIPLLPAGGQPMAERQDGLPAVETDGLAEQQPGEHPAQQQPGEHPAQQHQVALVGEPAVLTQQAEKLSMEPDLGIHGGLVWFRSPKLPWLPAHPVT